MDNTISKTQYTIVDRTKNPKRSSVNRQKIIKRVKKTAIKQISKQVADDGSITDLVKKKDRSISVPKKDLRQPTFRHGKGGRREFILPGNKKFSQGDRIPRPQQGQENTGKGKASKDGESEDAYSFNITHEEFLQFFFEDCELPDLRETTIVKTTKFDIRRAGFSTDGPPAMRNILRTMKTSKGRRIGLNRKKKKRDLENLEKEALLLMEQITDLHEKEENTSKLEEQLNEITQKIVVARRKLKSVPFLDKCDLRYNRWEKVPLPTTQAVMLNLMDVSASMGQWEKDIAKRFFMLLYLFLTRNYERVEVIWIRHHTRAKEVDEDEFFRGRETGGTLVSTGLTLMEKIIKERFPENQWNIYACQASDGDNWQSDTEVALDVLTNKILPIARYYAYIEVDKNNRNTDLWPKYEAVSKKHKNFQMKKVDDVSKIYPVFKELFRKRR